MSCYGQSFYQNYQRRLKVDPIGALRELREFKNQIIKNIDQSLADHGFAREEARAVEKGNRN